MIRNPRNFNSYFGKWNNKDSFSWKPEFIDQVPFGYNPLNSEPTGIFFIEVERFCDCFTKIVVSYYRKNEGYKTSSWYDIENDK